MIPARQSGEFVCRMEEVLEVYHRPYDERFPVVCLDETNKQLVSETRVPLPMRPGTPEHAGTPERYDHEYRREGVRQVFLAFEPLTNRRWTWTRPQKRAVDFAEVVQELLAAFPEAQRVRLVVDNLNTHHGGSFYERFGPAAARAMCERVEFVHTPKHGSWLNMAEIELSVLSRQCLSRRLGDADRLHAEVAAWTAARNAADATVHWRFTAKNARVKLHKLYPSVSG